MSIYTGRMVLWYVLQIPESTSIAIAKEGKGKFLQSICMVVYTVSKIGTQGMAAANTNHSHMIREGVKVVFAQLVFFQDLENKIN
jgi:hypothetical protein